jgi:hypothetical protein
VVSGSFKDSEGLERRCELEAWLRSFGAKVSSFRMGSKFHPRCLLLGEPWKEAHTAESYKAFRFALVNRVPIIRGLELFQLLPSWFSLGDLHAPLQVFEEDPDVSVGWSNGHGCVLLRSFKALKALRQREVVSMRELGGDKYRFLSYRLGAQHSEAPIYACLSSSIQAQLVKVGQLLKLRNGKDFLLNFYYQVEEPFSLDSYRFKSNYLQL